MNNHKNNNIIPVDKMYFTSDSHWGHDNIRKFCNRPFESVEEMDETLIKNWNEVVPEDGHVFHMGDVSFRSPEQTREILDRLNGKIYLIKGNHEKPALDSKCISRFEWIKDTFELRVDIEGKQQSIIMFHYPIDSWNKMFHGSIHLFGHIHSLTTDSGSLTKLRMDVGVDLNNFTPISLKQIMEIMKTRAIPEKTEK